MNIIFNLMMKIIWLITYLKQQILKPLKLKKKEQGLIDKKKGVF